MTSAVASGLLETCSANSWPMLTASSLRIQYGVSANTALSRVAKGGILIAKLKFLAQFGGWCLVHGGRNQQLRTSPQQSGIAKLAVVDRAFDGACQSCGERLRQIGRDPSRTVK